jgi:hypothetical protein
MKTTKELDLLMELYSVRTLVMLNTPKENVIEYISKLINDYYIKRENEKKELFF